MLWRSCRSDHGKVRSCRRLTDVLGVRSARSSLADAVLRASGRRRTEIHLADAGSRKSLHNIKTRTSPRCSFYSRTDIGKRGHKFVVANSISTFCDHGFALSVSYCWHFFVERDGRKQQQFYYIYTSVVIIIGIIAIFFLY